MSIASTPSSIVLPPPAKPGETILEFLVTRFPHVAATLWASRLQAGKVLDDQGQPLTLSTPYTAGRRIFYFREVGSELRVPFSEQVIFQNDEFLVVDKPHFLPVVPGGSYVNECLQERLRTRTGSATLTPLHRIDRDTAGLVLCSLNPGTRHHYHSLFAEGRIEKIYEALAPDPANRGPWSIANRLERGVPRFRMQIVDGPVNARSEIEWSGRIGEWSRFRLRPLTGKTHQLRVHMAHLGLPIVNDPYYPELVARRPGDYSRPLQLIARALRFTDPLSGVRFEFESAGTLVA